MSSPYDLAVTADSPTSYWPLSDASGTSAADPVGARNGTYAGGFTLNATPSSSAALTSAVTFNGSTGKVTVANNAALQFSGDFSLECWVNTTRSGTYNFLMGKFPTVTETGYGLSIDSSSGKAQMWVGDSGGSWALNTTRVVNDGAWHHVVGTRSGTAVVVYVDGVAQSFTRTASLTNTSPLLIAVDAYNQFFSGTLAGVAVYGAVLSQAQVTAHYRLGSGLVASCQAPAVARPLRPVPATPWKRGLLVALPFANEGGGPATGPLDAVTGKRRALVGTPTWGKGPWGTDLQVSDSAQGGPGFGSPLLSATQFTLSALCTTTTTRGGAAGLRQLWCDDTATANLRVAFTNGVLFFQLGGDGAFTNLNAGAQPVGVPVLVTARLAPGGVRSIWYGSYKQAERTDASIAYPATTLTQLVLGTGPTVGRNWSGNVSAGYVWNRALSDAEIVAFAGDPFAPVRPGKVSIALLAQGAGALGSRRRRVLLCAGGG